MVIDGSAQKQASLLNTVAGKISNRITRLMPILLKAMTAHMPHREHIFLTLFPSRMRLSPRPSLPVQLLAPLVRQHSSRQLYRDHENY